MSKIAKVIISTKGDDDSKQGFIQNLCNFFGESNVRLVTNMEGDGICEKYNLGIDEVMNEDHDENDWIVFCHDDIEPVASYESLVKALNDVEDNVYGCGVAGSTVVPPVSPFFWWNGLGTPAFRGAGAVEHWIPPENKLRAISMYGPYPSQVMVFDGLFMAIRLSVFKNKGIKFDAETLKGMYHFYDADLCAQMRSKSLKMVVIPFLVLHQSPGISMGQGSFVLAQQKMIKKWFKLQRPYNNTETL